MRRGRQQEQPTGGPDPGRNGGDAGDRRLPDAPQRRRPSVALAARRLLPGQDVIQGVVEARAITEAGMIQTSAALTGEHLIDPPRELPLRPVMTGVTLASARRIAMRNAAKVVLSTNEASPSGRKDVSGRATAARAGRAAICVAAWAVVTTVAEADAGMMSVDGRRAEVDVMTNLK